MTPAKRRQNKPGPALAASLLLLTLLAEPHFRPAACQSSFESGRLSALAALDESPGESAANASSPLVWQPLRATFRPLNRSGQPSSSSPPPPPEPAALTSSEPFEQPSGRPLPASSGERSFFVPIITTVAPASSSGESPSAPPSPAPRFDDEDQPTRVPLSRFRPTKSPSVDALSQPANSNLFLGANSGSQASPNNNSTAYRITSECFECICEASTSCNAQSRCQTSDVRHTRCGMFLISYDQWLDTGLSKQLVNREQLSRDAAADERAFYECVTKRECAERLISIYMQKRARDCDKDGRLDCYDVAAVHQGGVDQCNSESFLESQYWSDFNACFGFGRRKR